MLAFGFARKGVLRFVDGGDAAGFAGVYAVDLVAFGGVVVSAAFAVVVVVVVAFAFVFVVAVAFAFAFAFALVDVDFVVQWDAQIAPRWNQAGRRLHFAGGLELA